MEKFQEPRADPAPFSLPHLLTPLDSDSCRLHLLAGIAFAANEVSKSQLVGMVVWSGPVCSRLVFLARPQLFALVSSPTLRFVPQFAVDIAAACRLSSAA